MARAGAGKSLDQRTPKARGASEAVKPAPPKAAANAARKKADPGAVAPKPAAKAVKSAAPATKAGKTTKPAGGAGKTVKATPARAVNLKTKAAPVVKTGSTRKTTGGTSPNSRDTEVAQVAEAPKGKRAATATKAPAKAAPVPAVDPSGGFPPKTLDKLRRLLEEERQTYVRQAHDLAAEAEALAAEREPGDTQFDEESGEGDTLNVERERDLALSASATQAVEDIDRALRRMDIGTFGICERCGKKIAVARLEALPFAALCIECKSREERRR